MSELPIAPFKRLIKNTGARRVSEDAVDALVIVVEEIANEIAEKAIQLAEHAGRKTVTAKDIQLAQIHKKKEESEY